jgi:hypothetical protein
MASSALPRRIEGLYQRKGAINRSIPAGLLLLQR